MTRAHLPRPRSVVRPPNPWLCPTAGSPKGRFVIQAKRAGATSSGVEWHVVMYAESCLPNFRLKSQKITASGISGTYGADLTHLSPLYAQSLVPNGLAAHYGAWPLLLDEFPKGSGIFQSVAGSTVSWVAPYPGSCVVYRMVRSRILLT